MTAGTLAFVLDVEGYCKQFLIYYGMSRLLDDSRFLTLNDGPSYVRG